MMQRLTSPGDPSRMRRLTLWRTMSRRVFHPHDSSGMCGTRTRWQVTSTLVAVLCGALIVGGPLLNAVGFGSGGVVAAKTLATPSRSTTIALTSDEELLVVVNREANSVSIIRVKDKKGNDVTEKLAEVAVGLEPRCVAVHPDDKVA